MENNREEAKKEDSLVDQKMTRQLRRQMERRLRRIRITPTEINLTASTGLGVILEIFDKSPLANEFKHCLPERVSHRSVGSYLMGLLLLAGHIRGVENVSNLRRVYKDPYLQELFYDEVAAIRTIQDFLYDFEESHIEKLNIFLNKMAKSIFEQLQHQLPEGKRPEKFIIDMDDTHHIHYGEATEGLWFNYKGQWCLSSHVAFDQLGLCHGIELRSGNTKPGTGASDFIQRIFKDHRQQRLRKLEGLDYFRGDSAYCNQEVIKKCLELGLGFTITANKATTHWDQKMNKEGLDWQPWVYSPAEIAKANKSGQTLPRSEVSRFYWEPRWSESTLKFPIVIKRTWMTFCTMKDKTKKYGQRNIFELDTVTDEGEWQYYAVVTNLSLYHWSLQEVIEHHRKRGNAENFVKEGKYNFHLKNFPCEKLLPNKAWVIFAQIAHNLLRWVAILDNPDHPSFSKKIRDEYIYEPGRIVHRARQIFLRTSTTFQEVINKIHGWQYPGFDPARIFSTA